MLRPDPSDPYRYTLLPLVEHPRRNPSEPVIIRQTPHVPLRARHFRRAWDDRFTRSFLLQSAFCALWCLPLGALGIAEHYPLLALIACPGLLALGLHTRVWWEEAEAVRTRERWGRANARLAPLATPSPDPARALLDDWQRRFEARLSPEEGDG